MEYLLALLVGGVLTFNAVVTPNKAEDAIQSVLQKQFPAATVNVDIKGKRGRDVLRGRFKTLDVSMQNIAVQEGDAPAFAISAVPDAKNKGRLGQSTIQLKDIMWDGAIIDTIEIKMTNLVYDFKALEEENALRIVSSGPVSARIVLPAASVEKMVASGLKSVQEAKLTLRDDRVTLRGKTPLPIIKSMAPFTLTSKLEARNRNELWLIEPRLVLDQATGLALPAGPLLAGINPLLVVDKEKQWPYSVNITRVLVRDDKLEIGAELTFIPAKVVKK